MKTIVAIVEGHGEVKALPILLRRLAEIEGMSVNVPEPIRVHKDRFLNRPEEFRRFVELASRKMSDDDHGLVLLDADDDCPAERAPDIAAQIQAQAPHRRFSVVIAKSEFEGWFLAAAPSIAGRRGLPQALTAPADPEAVRDAKGWLSQQIRGGRYHEVSDQPALAALIDINLAGTASRSFRKLRKEVRAALSA